MRRRLMGDRRLFSCSRLVMLLILSSLLLAAMGQAAAGRLLQGGTLLIFGEPVVGTLDDQTFRQIYFFDGRAGDVISITLTVVEGDLDAYVLLTDEQGAILALSDDDGPGTDAQIVSKRLPHDGRYFVIATRFGQEHGSTAGDYTLLVERVGSDIAPAETTALRYGDSVLGQVTAEQPLVFYFLRGERGDVINLVMRRASGSLDPHLDLATADGRVLASNDDDPMAEGTLDAAITNYTLLESGVYLVVATRFGREAGDTEGTFVLSVTQTPPDQLGTSPEVARLIDYGMSFDGTLDDDTPVRYYRFFANRGDVITVTMAALSGDLNPLVKLADEALVELAQDDDGGDGNDARIAAYTIPASGMYYLLATRAGGDTGRSSGDYTLQLNGRAGVAGGEALEIMYGATVTGQIDNQRVFEEYVFFGQEGDTIRVSMQRASGDLDSLLTLYDSQHKQLIFSDDEGGEQNALIEEFVLPADDMYFLVASRYERYQGTTAGAYILTLELVRPGR